MLTAPLVTLGTWLDNPLLHDHETKGLSSTFRCVFLLNLPLLLSRRGHTGLAPAFSQFSMVPSGGADPKKNCQEQDLTNI